MLFHSFKDQNLEIYKLEGGALTDISNDAGTDSRPSRSLDSLKIVFQSNRSGTVQLYLVDANGQNLKQLTTTGNNINAMFGPDNKQVVYQSDRNGNWDIYVLDITSMKETQLTTDPHNDINPYWAPSADAGGQYWITFESDRSGNSNVLVLNVNSGDEFSVTRSTVNTVFPTWSPNGKQLGFLAEVGGVVYNLLVSNVDGSSLTTITNGVMDTGNPAWSPDGNKLAYQANVNGKLDVYTYDLTANKQYQVTQGEGVNSGPSWDCGGTMVAFTSTRTGTPNLFDAIWTGGSPAETLTTGTATNKWVQWAPTKDTSSRAH
jgi:Tol biopolymer transport system component